MNVLSKQEMLQSSSEMLKKLTFILLVVCFFANGQFANDVQIFKLFPIYSLSAMIVMQMRMIVRFWVLRTLTLPFTPSHGTSGEKGSKTTTTPSTTTSTTTTTTARWAHLTHMAHLWTCTNKDCKVEIEKVFVLKSETKFIIRTPKVTLIRTLVVQPTHLSRVTNTGLLNVGNRYPFHQYFTRIFLYESVLHRLYVLTDWVCNFLSKKSCS